MNTTHIIIAVVLVAAALTAAFLWRHKTQARGGTNSHISNLKSESNVANDEHVKPTYKPRPERTVALGYYIEPKKKKVGPASLASIDSVAIARKDCPIFAIAPPGSGKTVSVIVPSMLDWRGPVLATSVKYDLAKITWRGRALMGNTVIFDPGEELLSNPDDELTPLRRRWTPLANCTNMRDAMDIASALVAAGGSAGESKGDKDFWQGQAISVIGVLLWYTRTKPGTSLSDVNKLVSSLGNEIETTDPSDGTPVTIKGWDQIARDIEARRTKFERLLAVTTDPDKVAIAEKEIEEVEVALSEWHPIQGIAKSAEQTIGGVLAQVTGALRAVRGARELRTTKWDDPDLIDLEKFVLSTDTVYVVSPQRTGLFAPILTAFTQSAIDSAYKVADTYDSKRLPCELLCALDEVPSISPMPRLPEYTATARSYGIQLLCIAQSVVQTHDKWGKEKAGALLSNSSGAFMLLPGTLDPETLDWFSKLFGETRIAERTSSTSTTRGSSWGGGQKPSRNESTSESESISYTWRAVASPGKLRALNPKEIAVVVGDQAFQTVQRRWYEDEDLRAMANGQAEAMERLRTKYKYVTFES